MRVRAIRSHFVDGRVAAVGEVYEVSDTVARELIGIGRVVIEPPKSVTAQSPATTSHKPSQAKQNSIKEVKS